jgi:hypothetical protein
MSGLGVLLLGVIVVIVTYYVLPAEPHPLKRIGYAVGWCLIAVGLIVLLAELLGVSIGLGSLR